MYASVDPHELGTCMLGLMAEEMRGPTSSKERASRNVYVAHRDIVANPFKVIEAIYAERGMAFPPETKQAIPDWDRTHPANRHGTFVYDMAHYGKTPIDFDRAFGKYQKEFGEFL